MATPKKNLVVVIFPYFFIHDKEGIEVDGLKLKSSFTTVIDSEPANIKKELLSRAKLFRYGRNQQINRWSYITSYVSNAKQWDRLKEKLNKLTTVLRFSQLSDLKEHSTFNHFNYFAFEVTRIKTGFYQGILNGESSFSFYINKKGEVENPFIPHSQINPIALIAEEVINNEYFRTFYMLIDLYFYPGEDKKFLRSMEWFNRSYSHYGGGLDFSDAIVNTETAIEALLRPEDEQGSVKAQIVTAITNLIGPSTELKVWFDKFWKLRNSIVHGDVKTESLLYIHPGGRRGHKHHLYLGRKIFIKCFNALLKIRSTFPLIGIEDEFVSNEIRTKIVLRKISKYKTINVEKLITSGVLKFISGLRSDDISSSKKETKDLGNFFLPYVKADLEQNETKGTYEDMIEKIENVLKWKGRDYGDLALLYSELEKNYDSFYFGESVKTKTLALRGAAYNFFGYTTWRFLTLYD